MRLFGSMKGCYSPGAFFESCEAHRNYSLLSLHYYLFSFSGAALTLSVTFGDSSPRGRAKGIVGRGWDSDGLGRSVISPTTGLRGGLGLWWAIVSSPSVTFGDSVGQKLRP